jgi:hypothetical protein
MSISYSTTPNAQMSARVDRFTAGLLGRHVGRGSKDHARLRHGHAHRRRFFDHGRGSASTQLRETKVENLHTTFRRDLDVARLQVPVRDALFMCRL